MILKNGWFSNKMSWFLPVETVYLYFFDDLESQGIYFNGSIEMFVVKQQFNSIIKKNLYFCQKHRNQTNQISYFPTLGLGIAAYYGHLKIVEKLASVGARISLVDLENAENCVSPLYSAIRTGQTEVVKFFVDFSKKQTEVRIIQ